MELKRFLQEALTSLTGYSIINSRHGACGVNLFQDLKYKIGINPSVIFDVGANTGQTCAKFLKQFPHAEIHCFEPILDTYELLKENFQSHDRVIVNRVALGSENAKTTIRIHDLSQSDLNSLKPSSMSQDPNSKIEEVTVLTGDSYLAKNKIFRVDLLKIDTEGFEIEVLNGFQNAFSNQLISAVYCEVGLSKLNQRNTSLVEIFKILETFEFRFYGLYEIYHKRISAGNHFGNTLFIQKDRVSGQN